MINENEMEKEIPSEVRCTWAFPMSCPGIESYSRMG